MKGWHKESYRHYLASKGIKTSYYSKKRVTLKQDKWAKRGLELAHLNRDPSKDDEYRKIRSKKKEQDWEKVKDKVLAPEIDSEMTYQDARDVVDESEEFVKMRTYDNLVLYEMTKVEKDAHALSVLKSRANTEKEKDIFRGVGSASYFLEKLNKGEE